MNTNGCSILDIKVIFLIVTELSALVN